MLTNATSVATIHKVQYHPARDGAAAARVAHNHEVPGSSPGPATIRTLTPVFLQGFNL